MNIFLLSFSESLAGVSGAWSRGRKLFLQRAEFSRVYSDWGSLRPWLSVDTQRVVDITILSDSLCSQHSCLTWFRSCRTSMQLYF
jgi:hypothetical protein